MHAEEDARLQIPVTRSAFEPVLLAVEQVVELFDEFEKPVAVLLLLDHCAQLIHAFFFVWSHGRWDDRPGNAGRTLRRVFVDAFFPESGIPKVRYLGNLPASRRFFTHANSPDASSGSTF